MRIYHYHPDTKQLLGTSEARESPLEIGIYMIPSNATDIEPLEQLEGKIIVFDNNEWHYISVDFATSEEVITMTDHEKLNIIRQKRNNLLFQCDWTQLNDSPLTIAKITEWATYRQALRDIATQDIDNITWPNQPV